MLVLRLRTVFKILFYHCLEGNSSKSLQCCVCGMQTQIWDLLGFCLYADISDFVMNFAAK